MNASSTEAQWECPLVWNNLALAHFRAGEFALARLKLRRALRQTDHLSTDVVHSASEGAGNDGQSGQGGNQAGNLTAQLIRQTPLQLLNASHHHALMYNTGVANLFTQNPEAAFNALLGVIKMYPRNPRLWLRLAECCVKVQR